MSAASKISASQWQLALRWFERADGDLRIARAIVTYEVETIWGAALHCQQAIEKIAALTGWYFVARYPSGAEESLPSVAEIDSGIGKLRDIRHHIEAFAPKRGE